MSDRYTVLVTGGSGYLGSHTALDLWQAGFQVIAIDHLQRSKAWVPERLKELSNGDIRFYRTDCTNKQALEEVFTRHPDIQGVIHFAAYKSVGESVQQPLLYFDNNLQSLVRVLEVAAAHAVKHFVFSSSCSVYGNAATLPVTEETPLAEPESPYGRTKLMSEQIIRDFAAVNHMSCILLRYFNPAGAHHSGKLGEVPYGSPDNLVPVITQSAIGKRPPVVVYGTDYPTRDGSCIRDFIHVEDIADAHTKALHYLEGGKHTEKVEVFNLGSGNGVTVLEMLQAFERATGVSLAYERGNRRPGDVVAIYANHGKATRQLGWMPTRSIDDMMRSAWLWEQTLAGLDV